MKNYELYLKNLTSKDEILANEAAKILIDSGDVKFFEMLVNKTDFLYGFVRNNVYKRIENAINKKNFMNIINFFDIYSPYYDDLFMSILSKHANEDLTDKVFALLNSGTISQKTYAAKYFSYIPDTVAIEPLIKYAFSDDENLSANSAEALGQMQDDISFETALSLLESKDDLDQLKAVRFFVYYGKDFPLNNIFSLLKTSKIPENIAGQIPYMVSLLDLFYSNENFENSLNVFGYILSGFGEILPLSDIFQFEIYEILEYLLDMNSKKNENEVKISLVLLKAYLKFSLLNDNSEYSYDEDSDTKHEILSVFELLKSRNVEFWNNQKKLLPKIFENGDRNEIISALQIISELQMKEAIPYIKELINSNDEIIISEALIALKALNSINDINIDNIIEKIQNVNLKAIICNLKV